MEEIPLPSDTAPTSEWVNYAERRVSAAFHDDLADYFALARDVVDAAGPLVDRIAERPGEPRAIHAAALILARISSDLVACMQLLRIGYAAQAITLVGTMLELTHVLAYIRDDQSRAKEWAAWNKATSTYPGSIFKAIKETAATFGADDATVRREYEVIYRQICQIKHGNTIAIALPNSATIADYQCVVIGPILTEEFRRLGHAAAQWALRYAILAQTAFIRFHVGEADWPEMFEKQTRLSERHRALVVATKSRFEGEDPLKFA